jgi:hypothetical protein
VVADLERAILGHARAHPATDRGPFRGARCSVSREDERLGRADVLRYSCIAFRLRVATTPPQLIGDPYAARVDFPAGSYAFCRVTPVGGEGAFDPEVVERPPPSACIER